MGYIGYTELQKVTCDAFSVEVAVWRYIGYSIGYSIVTLIRDRKIDLHGLATVT